MPLRESDKSKQLASDLRLRIQNITRYDPEHVSSDSESDENFAYSQPPVNSALYGVNKPSYTNGLFSQHYYPSLNGNTTEISSGPALYTRSFSSSLPRPNVYNQQQGSYRSNTNEKRFSVTFDTTPNGKNMNVSNIPSYPAQRASTVTSRGSNGSQPYASVPEIQNIDRSYVESGILRNSDVEILSIIAGMADEQAQQANRSGDSSLPDDYQFTYLYGAFEAFTNVNNLSPDTYPAYYTLFNALVNLSKYKNTPYSDSPDQQPEPLRTWKECVEAFSKTYSAAELKRNKYIQLREKLRTFDDATRERFLALWYDAYITCNQETTRLNHLADTFANVTFTNSVAFLLRRWVLKQDYIKRMEHRAIHIDTAITKSKAFGVWQDKVEKCNEDEFMADGIFAQRYLRKWAAHCRKIKQSNAKADNICRKNIIRNTFNDWHQKNIESIVSDQYNSRLCLNIFNTWVDKTAKIINSKNIAEEWDESNMMASILQIWTSKYESIQQLNETADDIRDESLVRTTLFNWNRKLRDTITIEELETEWNNRLVARIFSEWKIRNLQIREARRFRDFICAYRAFKSWRLAAQCKQVMRSHNFTLISNTFRTWRLAEREKVLSRSISGKILCNVFSFMQEQVDVRNEEREEKLDEFTQRMDLKIQKQCLAVWRHNAKQSEANQEIADDFFAYSIRDIAAKALLTWYVKMHRQLSREDQATEMYETNLGERVMMKWKLSVVSARRQKRDDLLQKFLAKKDMLLKQRTLETLFAKFDAAMLLERKADIIEGSKNRLAAKKIFDVWADKLISIDAARGVAETLFRDNQLHQLFVDWQARLHRVLSLQQQAEELVEGYDNAVLENTLRVWRIRMFKLKTRYNAAKEFSERGDRRRARMALKIWRDKTALRLAQEPFVNVNQRRMSDGEVFGVVGGSSEPTRSSLTDARTQSLFRGTSNFTKFANGSSMDADSSSKAAVAAAERLAPFHPIVDYPENGVFSAPRNIFGRAATDDMSPLNARQHRNNERGRYQDYKKALDDNNSQNSVHSDNFNIVSNMNRLNMTEPRLPFRRHAPVSPPSPNYAIETPTRSRVRKPVPMTSISRWKLAMSTANIGSLTPTPSKKQNHTALEVAETAETPTNGDTQLDSPRNDVVRANSLFSAKRRGSRLQDITTK